MMLSKQYNYLHPMKTSNILLLVLLLVGCHSSISFAQKAKGKRYYTQEKRMRVYVKDAGKKKLEIIFKKAKPVLGTALKTIVTYGGRGLADRAKSWSYMAYKITTARGTRFFEGYVNNHPVFLNFLPSGYIEEVRTDSEGKVLDAFVWTENKKNKNTAKQKRTALKKRLDEYYIIDATGAFHVKNLNKAFLFQGNPKIGKEQLTPPNNAFQLGRETHFVWYLPTIPGANSRYRLSYGITSKSGEKISIGKFSFLVKAEDKGKSYLKFRLFPDLAKATARELTFYKPVIERFGKMKPGKHKLWLTCDRDKFKGFMLECSQEMISKCKKITDSMNNKENKRVNSIWKN